MSASREKKKRQEFIAGGGVDPKAAREAEQKAAERKSGILYTAIFVAFVILAVFLWVFNSGILQRNKTAVTIDGEKYTVNDVAFYYQQSYQGFLNQWGGYASLVGLDTSKSLKSQYAFGGTEQTWDDYFKEQAVETMKFVHASNAEAKANDVTLDQETKDSIDAGIASMKEAASSAGYTYKQYLAAMFGSTMTPSAYEKLMEEYLLAYQYGAQVQDGFSFTEDEIKAYYDENKNTYDLVDGGYVTVSGRPETKTDADGKTIEATDEEKSAALENAKKTAEAILAAYKKGGDLEKLAEENSASYYSSKTMSYSNSTTGNWLFDAARKSGDAQVLHGDDDTSYFVGVFNGRQRDEALDYNVRHILVTKDNLTLGEGEEATDEMIQAKAEEILAGWDGTEDGFAALAGEFSQDGGSKDNGGLYENVVKGQMVSDFNDWCYADGRKSGDTGIVSSSYGCHIMYFVGYGQEQYWHYACNSALVSNAYSEWRASITEPLTAETVESGMKLVG